LGREFALVACSCMCRDARFGKLIRLCSIMSISLSLPFRTASLCLVFFSSPQTSSRGLASDAKRATRARRQCSLSREKCWVGLIFALGVESPSAARTFSAFPSPRISSRQFLVISACRTSKLTHRGPLARPQYATVFCGPRHALKAYLGLSTRIRKGLLAFLRELPHRSCSSLSLSLSSLHHHQPPRAEDAERASRLSEAFPLHAL
jgi:hypothetical protein